MPQPSRFAPVARRALKLSAGLLAGVLALGLVLAAAAWFFVRASLPQLDGQQALPGLQAPVSLGRDALGTVVIEATHRLDAARALGFAHAQERFFEMDLARRSAAGELSVLFGPRALGMDRSRRVHRLRHRLSERWAQLPAPEQQLLRAYTEGVNQGLAALPVRPWAYGLLRVQPQPWQPVDSLLVVAEMFHALQGSSTESGLDRALLRERVGDALFEWLNPRGGRWDAALDDSVLPEPALPGPEVLDVRGRPVPAANTAQAAPAAVPSDGIWAQRQPLPAGEWEPLVGSNNWAVAGSRSAHGGALLADDMHLGLSAPGLWFRAQLQWVEGPQRWRVAGLTLPGVPAVVVGSNGQVAWGFTNAYGQWFEWVEVPAQVLKPSASGRDSAAGLGVVEEVLEAKGSAPERLVVREWKGAPIAKEEGGRAFALRWVAHEGEAYNLELDRFATARTAVELLDLARASGMPQLSVLVADRVGRIGWTLSGRLWQQPPLSQSYARLRPPDAPQPQALAEAQAPRLLQPDEGLLWTANNRLLGLGAAERMGDGGFDIGARAQQIRDSLRATPVHSEASLAALQLDREAKLMQAWNQRLQRWLLERAPGAAPNPGRAQAVAVLKGWNGRADADQAGYRLIRRTRLLVLNALWAAWTEPALGPVSKRAPERFKRRAGFEFSASAALDAQPPHLLPPGHASWADFGLAQLDAAVDELTQKGQRPLSQAAWGEENASRIQHVMSRALPVLGPWLDMPSQPQGGDDLIPHVARPNFGQSQRLVVSPGREELGILSMPGGQSGHPLSPFYGAGHTDWAQGRPTPLLAGEVRHRLALTP
jgi:penicillin amidase